ncbi:FtsK-like domain-containing protein [Rubripirellula lacrimiformis]|uniref:FtsK-like domain-containing protein n=1 Tax=Rubripirellula lacrimiformis TaxID=1930273 RepID=A0A517NL30_9BACT|nr:FtsK/SpoIIIE domain-containing protein [Rubripirellula lacrimiformis]QDT07847.1 FtsK-like domain-containing protein [Rubripirellula lacrimiformis]
MKDSSVSPAGLFDVRRQRRLLDGLAQRISTSIQQRDRMTAYHAQQRQQEESELERVRSEALAHCRETRHQMLSQWDQAEEQLTYQYESKALTHRMELNRLGVIFRRKQADETKVITRKVDSRRQAVLQQYENRKNQPGQIKRKEIKHIDDALTTLQSNLEWARALTIRRLDRLPDVPPATDPEDDMRVPAPQSVADTIDAISRLTRRSTDVISEMQTGAASQIVDRFYLPAGVAAFVVLWAIAAYFIAPSPPYLWMAAGIIPAGLLGFTTYLILLWPLKRMTRRLYPVVERIHRAAEECATSGRNIATQTANEASADLIRRRDAHLQSAARWSEEQLTALETRLASEQAVLRQQLSQTIVESDRHYTDEFSAVGTAMRSKAEAVAKNITDHLTSTDHSLQQKRETNAAGRVADMQRVATRLKAGVGRGLQRMVSTDHQVAEAFPEWLKVVQDPAANHDPVIDYVPIGSLQVDTRIQQLLAQKGSSDAPVASGESTPQMLANAEIPTGLPVVLHRRIQSCLLIRSDPASMDAAVAVAHQFLWRLLCSAPPSRAKLTLIDPLGRGQHFTSFMALADHDPAIVGHRVWTTDQKIEARLAELAHHVEDVLQSSLRDRFERIEDYNELAGSMAEPYRAIAAVGFPNGLSREAHGHLRALIESGLRCGIFTVLVCDESNPWPSDIPIPSGDKVLTLRVDGAGRWTIPQEGLDDLPFHPLPTPPSSLRPALVESIGTAAVAASRVEIPLESVLAGIVEGTGSTADEIAIAVGSQGANRSLSVELGEGVRQHVLIAGKTGSGKSTLLHSIITSGAYRYRPDQLQYYLLDFKKGVEFKPYADIGLPHARVIGIESEREFGRSVLQRLDAELQQRGEKFRAAGVQELAHYREASSEPMPRIMLVIDEFQELFVRDDRIAGDCAMLLDRLVRQGRSFGMHVVLSSQSLAGAYSLPRATLGQMAVRIAMQCSESDAALILSDDNTAARLISRPGEAIYNDAGGLAEGNQPFQVAWLPATRHREMLSAITARDQSYAQAMLPPVIFEGNRPCHWKPALADAALTSQPATTVGGLLGESVEIGPPVSLGLTRNTGRNLLLIAPASSRIAVLASSLSGFAKQHPDLELVYLDGTRADEGESLAPWLAASGIEAKRVRPRDSDAEMVRLSEEVQQRGDESDQPPIVVVIDPLERFRDLRQDESFSFSLDAAPGGGGGPAAFQSLLRDGPPSGVFVMLVCGSAETLSRWLPRGSQHDLELRVVGQMNQSDSSLLIDSPIASELSAATMLMYDDADGRISKFRQCSLPDPKEVSQWLGRESLASDD